MVGDHILESDIESYFVWIPRYQYKIWDMGKYTTTISFNNLTNAAGTSSEDTSLWKIVGNNSKLIDIKFGNVEKVPKMNESEAAINKYYTHPAFTLGEKELNGIWVGKFETGGKTADSIVVKPNVTPWRNETVKTFFYAGKDFAPELDSHMMKNTEWGATVYLSHSQYGINSDINVNNNSDYKTGYSATANANQKKYPGITGTTAETEKTQPYNTSIGYLASTTGNINGIYDMCGGTWEFVAACIDGAPGNSGFDTETLANEMIKGYIDKYDKESKITTYDKRILGDATGELGPFYNYLESNGNAYNHNSWYGGYAYFLTSAYPWFNRGSLYPGGPLASQLNFNRSLGGAAETNTFRLVLSPTNN